MLAAQQGRSVAVVERRTWGGACLNRGCVPKKIWYHTACLAADAVGFPARGLQGQLTVDRQAAWRHQSALVDAVRASYVDYLQRLGVARIEGEARLVANDCVSVNGKRLACRAIVIATGSRPHIPPGLSDQAPVRSTDELFEQPLPRGRRVGLVGGGAVGVEMAFILPLLGFELTWLTRREPLAASRFSSAARQRLAQALAKNGIAPRIGGRVPEVDWILAATGRAPNTEGLGLDDAGVRTTVGGCIEVDEGQATSATNVFAIGDCANVAMTANHALSEAEIAVANIVRPGSRRARRAWVPTVVHSALELARVGASEDELEDAGIEYAVGFASFGVNPAALAEGDSEGFVRLLVERDAGELLGCEIVGRQAGEMISLAEHTGAPRRLLARLKDIPFNHPGRGETFLGAAEQLIGQWGFEPG